MQRVWLYSQGHACVSETALLAAPALCVRLNTANTLSTDAPTAYNSQHSEHHPLSTQAQTTFIDSKHLSAHVHMHVSTSNNIKLNSPAACH